VRPSVPVPGSRPPLSQNPGGVLVEPPAAAELYPSDGTYHVTPFLEPLRGRQAILEYWTEVSRTANEISFGYEIFAVTE
jgi:hypothetical protein